MAYILKCSNISRILFRWPCHVGQKFYIYDHGAEDFGLISPLGNLPVTITSIQVCYFSDRHFLPPPPKIQLVPYAYRNHVSTVSMRVKLH